VFDASSGDREWTAVQAHAGHWDRFEITHRVDSVEQPRRTIERRAIARPETTASRPGAVRRQYFGNGDSFDGDGWVTAIRLPGIGAAGAAGAVGAALLGGATTDRRTRRWATLALGIVGWCLPSGSPG